MSDATELRNQIVGLVDELATLTPPPIEAPMPDPMTDGIAAELNTLYAELDQVAQTIDQAADTLQQGVDTMRHISRGLVEGGSYENVLLSFSYASGPTYAVTVDDGPFTLVLTLNRTNHGRAKDYVFTWVSSDPTIATVVAGLVTPLQAGTVTITASLSGYPDAVATVVVSDPTPSVRRNVLVTWPGAPSTMQLTASGNPGTITYQKTTDQFGVDMSTGTTIKFTSSNVAVATVGLTTGIVTPVGAGSCTITIEDETDSATGPTATVTLSVVASATATSCVISPGGSIQLQAGDTLDLNAVTLDGAGTVMGSRILHDWSLPGAAAGHLSINATSGLLAASTAGGPYTVTVADHTTPGATGTCSVTVVAVPTAGTANSPTGRNPTIGFSTTWQYEENQISTSSTMYLAAVAEAQAIQSAFASAPTAAYAAAGYTHNWDLAGYGNNGYSTAWLYQRTGDVAYAQLAYQQMLNYAAGTFTNGHFKDNFPDPAPSPDYIRSQGSKFVQMIDWIYPALSSAQKTLIITRICRWADQVLNSSSVPAGQPALTPSSTFLLRLNGVDSDQYLGFWAFFYCLQKATWAEKNSYYNTLLDKSILNVNQTVSQAVGGLTATGLSGNLRNHISKYFTVQGQGGSWFEAISYNADTVNQGKPAWLTMFYNGDLDTYFPEIKSWHQNCCDWIPHSYSPTDNLGGGTGGKSQWSWGDEVGGQWRNWTLYRERNFVLLASSARLNQGASRGKKASKFLNDFYADTSTRKELEGAGGVHYGVWNPNADATATYDWLSAGVIRTSQVGGMILKTSTDQLGLFASQSPAVWDGDHAQTLGATFWHFGNQEEATRIPRGYANAYDPTPYSYHALMCAGMYSANGTWGTRGERARFSGADWMAMDWGYAGPYHSNTPSFLTDARTRIVTFQVGGATVYVIRDDVTGADPTLDSLATGTKLPWSSTSTNGNYSTDEKRRGNLWKARAGGVLSNIVERHFFSQGAWTAANATTTTWDTPRGLHVQVKHLYPATIARYASLTAAAFYDEAAPGATSVTTAGLNVLRLYDNSAWGAGFQTKTWVNVWTDTPTTHPTITTTDVDHVTVGGRLVTFSATNITVV